MLTESGHKAIENIEIGDKVWAYDEETGEQALKEVVTLFRNETSDWVHVYINDEEKLTCTKEHPFFIPDLKQWVNACDLTMGMNVLLSTGNYGKISSVEVEHLDTPETTYNFEVRDYHTYYVGESNVLVHNDCIHDALGVDDFSQIGSKYTPDELINKLDDLGFSKEVTFQSANSGPSTIMKSSDYGVKFRIQATPANGNAYFRVFNSAGHPLAGNGLFPHMAGKTEMRILTHFNF